jgi:type IV pilus assembly protein PilP
MSRKLNYLKVYAAKSCAFVIVCILSGCFNSKDAELQQWMVEQKGNTPAKVPPIVAPKKFVPQAYTQQSAMELGAYFS